MSTVVPCYFSFIGVIRAKRRKEVNVRDSKRLCLVRKGNREVFDSLILFIIKNRRRTNHKHGISLSPAQNRSDVCARFREIDAHFSILDDRIVDAT